MASSFDMSGFEKLQKDLQKLQREAPKTVDKTAKDMALRLLTLTVKRTPVGDYDKTVNFTTKDGKKVSFTPKTGKKGGTLRRGWTVKTQEEAENGVKVKVSTYIDSLSVHHWGNNSYIEIINPVEYAPYVEYGHRTNTKKSWVKGRFMLTDSLEDLKRIAPKVIQKNVDTMMKEVFG